jgi:hypothetical protein
MIGKQNKVHSPEDIRKLPWAERWEPPKRKDGLALFLAVRAGARHQGAHMPTARPAIEVIQSYIDSNIAHRPAALVSRGAIHG